MERRDFLKLSLGFAAGAAGAAALVASAQAAPLSPAMSAVGVVPSRGGTAQPALTDQEDVDRLAPEPVRFRRRFRRRFFVVRRRFRRRRFFY